MQSKTSPIFEACLARVRAALDGAEDSGDVAPLKSAVLAAVAGAESAEQLWRLLSEPPFAEPTFGEGEHPQELASAILDRAQSWSDPVEAGCAVGLAVRITSFEVAPLLRRDQDQGVKGLVAGAVEAHVDELREGIRSEAAPSRAASAHALGRCRNATAADALSRACAACAAGLVAGRAGARTGAALAEAIRSPREVPAQWGWRWPAGQVESTATMAARLLGWIEVEDPSPAIRALAAAPELGGFAGDALFHLAFADGAAVSPFGLALPELSDDQRAAAAAFAELSTESHRIVELGLARREDVAPFLAGEEPPWRPLEVQTQDGLRRWHLSRIWREHVWSELPQQAAVDALAGGIEPAALLRAICAGRRSALLQVHDRPRDAAKEVRDQQLVAAILQRLPERGFDAGPALAQMARAAAEWDPVTLATCLLAGGEAPPKKLLRLISAGIAAARSPETHARLLAKLEPKLRAVLAGAKNASQQKAPRTEKKPAPKRTAARAAKKTKRS